MQVTNSCQLPYYYNYYELVADTNSRLKLKEESDQLQTIVKTYGK